MNQYLKFLTWDCQFDFDFEESDFFDSKSKGEIEQWRWIEWIVKIQKNLSGFDSSFDSKSRQVQIQNKRQKIFGSRPLLAMTQCNVQSF